MRLSNGEVLLRWPLSEHVITVGWLYSDGSAHNAIDLRTNQGGSIIKPVYAAESGTIDWVQYWDGHTKTGNQSYGNLIRIRHADYNRGKLQTYYAHLSSILVKEGQFVQEGEIIGYTGETGNVFGAHLHFEVRLNGIRYNPLNWLDGDFTVADSSVILGDYTSVTVPQTPKAWGVDVSKYQYDIDWKKVASAGVQFAIIRVGSSDNNGPYIDPYFEKNYAGAKEAGLAVGAYFYTYADTEEKQNDEILTFLPALEGKTFEYPVFVDVEDNSIANNANLTALVKRAMDILDQKGFVPGYYSYTNYLNNYIDTEALKDYPLWVADYRSSFGYSGDYVMWQYTSEGSVDGIPGNVDLNYDYHGYLPEKPVVEPEPEKPEENFPDPEPETPQEPETPDEPVEVVTKQMIQISNLPNAAAMRVWDLCKELKLTDQGLYHADYVDRNETDQNLDIGPVSNEDAFIIFSLIKDLGANDGRYSSKYVQA